MIVEQVILSALKANPALSGLTIRPDKIEETDSTPYIIYQKIVERRESSLSGDSGLANIHYQIDVFSTSRLEAVSLRVAVRQAMLAEPLLGATHSSGSAAFEEDVKLFRETSDFSCWVND